MSASSKGFGLSPLVPVPWASIRSWLDKAEQTQAAAGGSTLHLQHAQLLALSRLADFVEEPPIPKEDAVSKLLRMSPAMLAAAVADAGSPAPAAAPAAEAATPMDGIRFANGGDGADLTQGKHLGTPTFEMGEPVDVPYRGAFQLRWHCVCVLPWCDQRFPNIEAGQSPALFLNKKDAKQYAAMQALAYLNGSPAVSRSRPPREPPQQTPQLPPQQLPQQIAQQFQPIQQIQPIQPPQPPQLPQPQIQIIPSQPNTPPTSNILVAVPTPETPPSVGNRPKRPLESPTTRENPGSPLKQRQFPPSPTPAAQAPAPPPLLSPRGKGEAAAEQNRLFNSIARLTGRLGISQPQYKLTQDPERQNFFSGRAEFSVASRVPDNIAVVQDVLGKKQARIQIAEQVLSWLEKEEARRQAMVDGLLSGL